MSLRLKFSLPTNKNDIHIVKLLGTIENTISSMDDNVIKNILRSKVTTIVMNYLQVDNSSIENKLNNFNEQLSSLFNDRIIKLLLLNTDILISKSN